MLPLGSIFQKNWNFISVLCQWFTKFCSTTPLEIMPDCLANIKSMMALNFLNLASSHWLPVHFGVDFKIYCLFLRVTKWVSISLPFWSFNYAQSQKIIKVNWPDASHCTRKQMKEERRRDLAFAVAAPTQFYLQIRSSPTLAISKSYLKFLHLSIKKRMNLFLLVFLKNFFLIMVFYW